MYAAAARCTTYDEEVQKTTSELRDVFEEDDWACWDMVSGEKHDLWEQAEGEIAGLEIAAEELYRLLNPPAEELEEEDASI